ncbi:MAG TPA: hypothetical protein VHW92_08825 [Mycobacteriales bacterium]|nr:hypothetical protein [Mycobacteriales bacterium]
MTALPAGSVQLPKDLFVRDRLASLVPLAPDEHGGPGDEEQGHDRDQCDD